MLIAVLVWLLLGYSFTYWFVNSFLDNRKFDDQNEEVGPGMLLMLTLCGPAMAGVMLVFLIVGTLLENTGPFIKKMYGG